MNQLDDPRIQEVFLTNKQSTVMVAKSEGLSIRQIARLLNISEPNVVYTIRRARLILNAKGEKDQHERWS